MASARAAFAGHAELAEREHLVERWRNNGWPRFGPEVLARPPPKPGLTGGLLEVSLR